MPFYGAPSCLNKFFLFKQAFLSPASLFVLLEGATKERAFQVGREIVDAVTAVNPKPVKLKFEKVGEWSLGICLCTVNPEEIRFNDVKSQFVDRYFLVKFILCLICSWRATVVDHCLP